MQIEQLSYIFAAECLPGVLNNFVYDLFRLECDETKLAPLVLLLVKWQVDFFDLQHIKPIF